MARDDGEFGAFFRANRLVEARLIEVTSLLVGAAFAIVPRLSNNDTRNVVIWIGWILHDLDVGQHTWDSGGTADRQDGARLEPALCSAGTSRSESRNFAVLWSGNAEAVVVFFLSTAELEFLDGPLILSCVFRDWSSYGG